MVFLMATKNVKRKPLNEPLLRAVKVMRFQRTLAVAIGVKQQNIWSWLYESGVVPAEHVLLIETVTRDKGDLVSRHDLRPDIYPKSEVA